MFSRTNEFCLLFIRILVIALLSDVSKLVQSQQVLNGANVNSTLIKSSSYRTPDYEVSERMEFEKTKTPPFFSCFDLDACRTGLDFCNQRRKACEKCEDYQRTCGTNLQQLNCTEYCVGLLVKERCMANVVTKQTTTPTATGKFLESREQKNASDCLNKPGDKNDLKFIITIGILGSILVVSFVLHIYCICRILRSKSKELTNEQSPLMNVCSTGPPSEDPIIIDVTSGQYSSSVQQNGNSGLDSVQSSTSTALSEIRDLNQTTVKEERTNHKYMPSRPHETDIGNQNSYIRRVSEDNMELNSMRAEEQGQEMAKGKWSKSGYGSSSTQSLTGNPVINNNVNITFNGMQNHTNAMPTETEREASKPENIRKEVPYSVQETYDNDKSSSSVNFVVNNHAQTKNQKPISDENNCAKIAIGDMSVGMDDVTNCYEQHTSM